MEPQFDLAWRQRAISGDTRAVDDLAQAGIEPLYAFCFFRVGRRKELCEEVVQETMMRALTQLKSYDPGRCGNDIWGWLSGLARNEIRRTLAREKNSVALTDLWDRIDQDLLQVYARIDSEPLNEDVLEKAQTREMVQATMAQLPPPYRSALEAKYVQGQSIRVMAAQRHTSEKAMESQLERARKAFRATFAALSRHLSLEAIP